MACYPDPDPCSSDLSHVYDPDATELTAWPDDTFTTGDTRTRTGRRVVVSNTPWVDALEGLPASVPTQMNGASGFARVGSIFVRFSDPVELPSAGVQLLDLSTDAPLVVETLVQLDDEDTQLTLTPLVPLAAGHEHALVITKDYQPGGRCVTPAPPTTAALPGSEALLERLGLESDQVSVLLRFTTHDDQIPAIAAAEHALETPPMWTRTLDCAEHEGFTRCETAFDPIDYRSIRGPVEGIPRGRHEVPVTWWLPEGVSNPPVVLLGHGLGGRRDDGNNTALAESFTALGLAVVASEALQHGDHPTADPDALSPALPFLGLDLANARFDGLAIRANFDQSALERVQLLDLIASESEGAPQVDGSRVAYVGISLGGLLGPGVLALSPEVEAGALPVGGGNLITITQGTEVVANLLPALSASVGSDAALDRLLIAAQSVVDPSDPALWATRVMEDRLDGAPAPDVLLPAALGDTIVPEASARVLARSLGLTHLEPVEDAVAGLPSAPGPLRGNHPTGATAVYAQYRDATIDGQLVPAGHDLLRSEEAFRQLVHFMQTWRDGESEVIDPFAP